MKKITISESISSNTKCDCTLTALLSQPISDFRENRRMKTRANEVLRKQRDLAYYVLLMITFHLQLVFGKAFINFFQRKLKLQVEKVSNLRSHRMEQIFLISHNLLINENSLKNF